MDSDPMLYGPRLEGLLAPARHLWGYKSAPPPTVRCWRIESDPLGLPFVRVALVDHPQSFR